MIKIFELFQIWINTELKTLQAAYKSLSVDLDGWIDDNGHKMTEFLRELKVVNDLAKRCIKEI